MRNGLPGCKDVVLTDSVAHIVSYQLATGWLGVIFEKLKRLDRAALTSLYCLAKDVTNSRAHIVSYQLLTNGEGFFLRC
jgi:hypothetical protein